MEQKTFIERIRESLHRDLTKREAVRVAIVGVVVVLLVTGLIRVAVITLTGGW